MPTINNRYLEEKHRIIRRLEQEPNNTELKEKLKTLQELCEREVQEWLKNRTNEVK